MAIEKTPNIAAVGEVVFDIFPDSRKLGGAPADFLHYAAKAGANAYLVSAIGADDLGREVTAELLKFNIEPVLAVTPYPTGRVLIFKSPGGRYTAHILENAAWDYIPLTEASEQCLKKADAVYFGTLALRKSYSRQTILELIDTAPAQACRFFDVNLRHDYYGKEIISELLERSDILKLNSDELKALKGLFGLKGHTEDACLALKEKFGLSYLIFSDAAKESRIYGDNETTVIKNSRIQQAFAYGAGNAFAGAFMTALIKGCGQKAAHEAANKAAVEVCKRGQSSKQPFLTLTETNQRTNSK